MAIEKDLLDQLLAGRDPKDVFNKDGLVDELKKALSERILNTELDEHLDGESVEAKGNHRNGYSKKSVLTGTSKMTLSVPRDRAGTFDPKLIAKYQRRFPDFDDKIISMYARGMTVREIRGHLEELYGIDVSPDLISAVTDAVLDEVAEWQNRPLDICYPLVFFDAIRVKVRDEGFVRNKAIYIALGVLPDGTKEILGIWIEQTEGAKFWLRVINELKTRGAQDILIAVVDGLKGFPEAINAVFPQTIVQTCIVHLIRHSMDFASWKDRKSVAQALRTVYRAVDAAAGQAALDVFAQGPCGAKYPAIAQSWRRNWELVIPFFAFPEGVRRIICTTNAIEALNSKLRRAVRTRGHFPSDDAASKLLYLVLNHAAAEWKSVGEFTVETDQSIPFVLSYGLSFQSLPPAIDPFGILQETGRSWRGWSDRCPDVGPWTAAVKRSVITLKALTYAPSGGMVAAATTSLPEDPGGVRNWDYRYCWLRDATFTLQAFMHLGYYDEARAWRDWITRAIAGSPDQVQIMYGVGGERWLPELIVPWLPGYENSSPVRIGNGAHQQLQIDVFGEVVDVMVQARKGGMGITERGRAIRPLVMDHLARAWREPDEGIWEVRGQPQHFVHSKVMAWVAFDRAANEFRAERLNEEAGRWHAIADEIHAEVCARGFDPELNSFVQAYGSKRLDASLLLLPLVGFLPATDPRVQATLRAIEETLLFDGEFVLRYETDDSADGLPAGEGAFLACSFWLVSNYILQGRYADARRLFDRLLARCNDIGLLAEEIDPSTGRMLGNFPQAYSHVGLIVCALNLSRETGPAGQTVPITVARA